MIKKLYLIKYYFYDVNDEFRLNSKVDSFTESELIDYCKNKLVKSINVIKCD